MKPELVHHDLQQAANAALILQHAQSEMQAALLDYHFHQAAIALGYTITKEATHDVAQAPSRDPDSGRASSELGAPETALHQNYGA